MKKIIAILLLIIFTTNISLANNVQTINSDKDTTTQEMTIQKKSEPVSETQIENTNNKNDEATETNNKEKNITTQDNNPDVSKTNNNEIEMNIYTINENNEILNKYNKKFNKYASGTFKAFYKENLSDQLRGYASYSYPEIDNFDKNDPKILRFELQDGDYAILNTNIKGFKKYKYAAEYHQDGTLFGIVQIRTIRCTKKSVTIQFYEYRDYKETNFYIPTHSMFVDLEKTKDKLNISQFVYKDVKNGKFVIDKLICAQINNNLYLNEASKNLIVKMKKFELPETYTKAAENRGEQASSLVGTILLTPIVLPMFVLALPILVVFLVEFHRLLD